MREPLPPNERGFRIGIDRLNSTDIRELEEGQGDHYWIMKRAFVAPDLRYEYEIVARVEFLEEYRKRIEELDSGKEIDSNPEGHAHIQ